MTGQSANDQFHASSFIQGHNAEYLEQMCVHHTGNTEATDGSGQDPLDQPWNGQ
jgi:2-oxoglutarate dehydrogenase E1 component